MNWTKTIIAEEPAPVTCRSQPDAHVMIHTALAAFVQEVLQRQSGYVVFHRVWVFDGGDDSGLGRVKIVKNVPEAFCRFWGGGFSEVAETVPACVGLR